LRLVVGVAAIVAPVLHCITDAMEWYQGGFSPAQLWLNYLAFLPMPWLLLGIYAVRAEALGSSALVGALLYGVAFTYFAHTTLYALAAWAALRKPALPRLAVPLFAAGLLVNLGLAVVPAPEILQTVGMAIRNAGLVGMGYALVSGRPDRDAQPPCGWRSASRSGCVISSGRPMRGTSRRAITATGERRYRSPNSRATSRYDSARLA
jgi:hypothetical protein